MNPHLGEASDEKPTATAPLRTSGHDASVNLPANFLPHQPPRYRTRPVTAFAGRIASGVHRACRTAGIRHA